MIDAGTDCQRQVDNFAAGAARQTLQRSGAQTWFQDDCLSTVFAIDAKLSTANDRVTSVIRSGRRYDANCGNG